MHLGLHILLVSNWIFQFLAMDSFKVLSFYSNMGVDRRIPVFGVWDHTEILMSSKDSLYFPQSE